MRKSLLVISLLLFAFTGNVLLPRSALATVCYLTGTWQERVQQTEAIFSGKVVQIKNTSSWNTVTFEVSRSWKGNVPKNIDVTTAGVYSFGFPFKEDEEYLVYASRNINSQLEVSSSSCTDTKLLREAGDDLSKLGQPRLKKFIIGAVSVAMLAFTWIIIRRMRR